jgi:hypothetical protein
MLAAIQQMEQRLHAPPPSAPSAAPAGPPPPAAAAVAALDPAVLRDMLRSLDRLEHREQEARRRWLQPQAPGLVLAPGQGAGGGAAAAAHATPAQLPQQLQPAPAEEAEAREEVISDAMLRSVLRGRRRFLRRQQLLQGDLAPAAGLQPTQASAAAGCEGAGVGRAAAAASRGVGEGGGGALATRAAQGCGRV